MLNMLQSFLAFLNAATLTYKHKIQTAIIQNTNILMKLMSMTTTCSKDTCTETQRLHKHMNYTYKHIQKKSIK